MDEYEVPEAPAFPLNDAEVEKLRREIREHYSKRYWEPGRTHTCPRCHAKALHARDDLSIEVPRGSTLVIYKNIRGAECKKCGSRFTEVADTLGIEDDLRNAWRATFEGKVTTIGRESLGLYFPRDVVRNTRMKKDMGIEFEVIDPRTVVLHFA